MSRSTISNDILNITAGIKLETGVSGLAIRGLIEEFAVDAQLRRGQKTPELFEYLWVEDIPQHRRGEFLAALSSLSAPAGSTDAKAPERMISATDIWASRNSL